MTTKKTTITVPSLQVDGDFFIKSMVVSGDVEIQGQFYMYNTEEEIPHEILDYFSSDDIVWNIEGDVLIKGDLHAFPTGEITINGKCSMDDTYYDDDSI
jgi:hypothetical protein